MALESRGSYAYGPKGYDGSQPLNNFVPEKGVDGYIQTNTNIDNDLFTAEVISKLGNTVFDSWLNIILDKADEYYRNHRLIAAKELYELLISLASKNISEFQITYFNKDVYVAASNQLGKIKLGLNFFGYSRIYAPILNRKVYQKKSESIINGLALAEQTIYQIETLQNITALSNTVTKFFNFQVSIAHIEVDEERNIASNKIVLLENDIENYTLRHQYLVEQLEQMTQTHERLVQTTNGNSFDLIDFAKGMITVYYGGVELYEAYKASEFLGVQDISWKFLESNSDALGKIAGGISESGIIGFLLNDEKKLYSEVDLLNLKYQIKEFTLAAMDTAHDIATAKLELIFERSRLGDLKQKQNYINQMQLRVDFLLQQNQIKQNDIEEIKIIARLVYNQFYQVAHRYLFYFAKAQEFLNHTNVEQNVIYGINSAAQLNLQLQKLIEDEIIFYNDFDTKYSEDVNYTEIKLLKSELPWMFELFHRTGTLNFRLKPDNFDSHKRQIRIKEIDFCVKNISSYNGVLKGYLTHLGKSRFIMANGDVKEYVHRKQQRYYEYDTSNWKRLNREIEEYQNSFVSPISSWQLEVNTDINPLLDIKNIDEIILNIKTIYLPIN